MITVLLLTLAFWLATMMSFTSTTTREAVFYFCVVVTLWCALLWEVRREVEERSKSGRHL